MHILRAALVIPGCFLFWQFIVTATGVPAYILPGPYIVLRALVQALPILWGHLLTTATEILTGLILGVLLGMSTAGIMYAFKGCKRWLLPLLVTSQAIPVFALAPILVLWFGYGIASKIAMTVLIIFFPVTASFYSGLQNISAEFLELARTMNAKSRFLFRHVLFPAALPTLGAGLRVAAAVAPIGAVVGEWVGSSSGLGFYMLHANARMQTANMFAALLLLVLFSLTLYFCLDRFLHRLIFWNT